MSEDGGGLERKPRDAMEVQRPPGVADPIDRDALARLCSPPARWGYERVEPRPPAPSRERQSPPKRKQVRLMRARAHQVCGRQRR